jgi:hypothetical protein
VPGERLSTELSNGGDPGSASTQRSLTHVADLGAHGERLELRREDVEHGLAADDCGGSARNDEPAGVLLCGLIESYHYSHAVPPRGTWISSPVPSSYLHTWGSPFGTLTA